MSASEEGVRVYPISIERYGFFFSSRALIIALEQVKESPITIFGAPVEKQNIFQSKIPWENFRQDPKEGRYLGIPVEKYKRRSKKKNFFYFHFIVKKMFADAG